MSNEHQVTLRQDKDYRFAIDFGQGLPVVYGDEPPPLGTGTGPTPVQLLVSAVGNCLSDSLLFSLRKFKQAPEPITTHASAQVGRSPEGRMRVLRIDVELNLGVPAASLEFLDRVLSQYEAFCTVSQSVAQGLPIYITIKDATGAVVKAPAMMA